MEEKWELENMHYASGYCWKNAVDRTGGLDTLGIFLD